MAGEPGKRAGTDEGRSVGVRRDRGKQHGRARLIVPRRMEGLAVSLQTLPLRPEPTRDRRGRPRGRLVLVAVGAGVARLKLVGEIGARNAEAVIVPLVDHHEGPLGHMAGHATDRRVDPLVMIMRGLA